ncbi:MAG: haloacid dehalogenase type II, partial [Gaiellaceae bacterium]
WSSESSMSRWATFDCYGTLIDWMGGIRSALAEVWPDEDADRLLARYHELEPEVQAADPTLPYREVMRAVLVRIAEDEGLGLAEREQYALAESLPSWRPFPEVPGALAELRSRDFRVVILSNTDPDLLAASVERIGVEIDDAITASEAGSYKPAPGHWERFFERHSVEPEQHVHVGASLFHDIEPAARMGMKAVWINRLHEESDLSRAAELPDLSRLPDVLDELVPVATL